MGEPPPSAASRQRLWQEVEGPHSQRPTAGGKLSLCEVDRNSFCFHGVVAQKKYRKKSIHHYLGLHFN
jgi:hypothetical protein